MGNCIGKKKKSLRRERNKSLNSAKYINLSKSYSERGSMIEEEKVFGTQNLRTDGRVKIED